MFLTTPAGGVAVLVLLGLDVLTDVALETAGFAGADFAATGFAVTDLVVAGLAATVLAVLFLGAGLGTAVFGISGFSFFGNSGGVAFSVTAFSSSFFLS
ncbi:hypothetical protein [Flavobacterium sp. 1]|uniref:hypothetical protein n=1 Tax=Flavobacterium sp. 1 TaxID=2035200 RepID=UPI0012FE2D85|nr:hypothetical protein [Flavobacterium sp. 1]